MRWTYLAAILLISSGSCINLQAQAPASFRVLFGLSDTAHKTRWDGTLTVTGAGTYRIEGWRFEGADQFSSNLGNHNFYLTNQSGSLSVPGGAVAPHGFIVNAAAVSDQSEFKFTTAQGDFDFRATDVPYGKGIYRLGGRVYVDRVLPVTRLSDTRHEEEDYPAAAAGVQGEVWLAYVQFHHSRDYNKLRTSPPTVPTDFRQYAEPTGGDQIWARKWSSGKWGPPIAVTPAGGDRYKAAVAVAGNGQAWVFWSENHRGNFVIFARPVAAPGPGERLQISTEAGADVEPDAVTDASGKVWVAWQGWRNGVAAIYIAHQEGGRFSRSTKVSQSSQNEWSPALAADRTGRVAVGWDSYRKGDYDVYVRVWTGNAWTEEIPVAATTKYEANCSLAYDPSGRLWIAYEEGGRGWGKDFGAYASKGIALYQGRLVKLRGLEPSGRLISLDVSPDSELVGVPSVRAEQTSSQADSKSLDPDPDATRRRLPSEGAPIATGVAMNTLPRLAVDASGRFWLAFRTPHPRWWSPLGMVWTEYVVSFDGKAWTKPIFLNHTDNLLESRPAVVPTANGKLLVVNSSDGRRNFQVAEAISSWQGLNHDTPVDPYNDDLWSQEVDLGPARQGISVQSLGPEAKPEAPERDDVNTAAVRTLREYRGGPGGNLRIVRGEFHRHADIDFDGGGDGTLTDQWRYILDAAAFDWVGCCGHDNGGAREYPWWITQKLTDIYYSPGTFAPMFSYERSVGFPEGHRNVVFAQRGIRPLPRFRVSHDPVPITGPQVHSADTQMLYAYLKQFDGIVASHSSATLMGTDWRDNDPTAEPVVEIYQGDRQNYEMPGAPRSSSEKDAIHSWRPQGFVNIALDKGYKMGFEASSDHYSTHISYCNLYVKDLTRQSVLEAFHKRHVYAATDDILADVESGSHMMGDEFSTRELPTLKIKLRGTSKFAKVSIIRDGKYVFSTSPNLQDVELSWQDNQPSRGKASYYYVRAEQDNGEIVWASPMWITYTGN